MPSKYDEETRAMALRLVVDHRGDYPSEWSAIKAVSPRLGTTAETLRNCIRQREVDDGQRDGVSIQTAAELRALKKRNHEHEETIDVLKTATSFFVRKSDPPTSRHRPPDSCASSLLLTRATFGSLRSVVCSPSITPRSPRERFTRRRPGRRRNGPCGA